MSEEKKDGVEKKSSNFFWIYILLFFSTAFILIYVSSLNQANIKKENQAIQDELTEQKTFSQGIQASIRDLTDENERLRSKSEEQVKLIDSLKANCEVLKQLNPNYLANLEKYEQLKTVYEQGNINKCKELIKLITPELIPAAEAEHFQTMKNEILK